MSLVDQNVETSPPSPSQSWNIGFWSQCKLLIKITDFKTLCSNFDWGREGLSPHFDQQLTLTSKPYVPTLAGGGRACLHILINKWHWLLKSKFQFWPVRGCLHLLLSKWHWLQKHNFPLCMGEGGLVSTFWSATYTDFKTLCSNFDWGREGLSPHFDQQLTLTSKPYVPTLAGGERACLHILINKWHWLLKSKFQFWPVRGCLHLLLSKWHWLQKHNFPLCMGEGGLVSTFWSAT